MKTITVKIQVPDDAYQEAGRGMLQRTGYSIKETTRGDFLMWAARHFGLTTTVNIDVNIEESA